MQTPGILRIDTAKGILRPFDILPFLKDNDISLRTKTAPFDFKNSQIDPVYLATSLFETMFQFNGIGLAANQVGHPYSVFVVGADRNNKQVFFNPEILEMSTDQVVATEGCLTFPQLFLHVKRANKVKIKYQHVNGEDRIEEFSGMTARIILHEYDHLQGVLFTDTVPKLSVMMAKDKQKKIKKKMGRTEKKKKGYRWE